MARFVGRKIIKRPVVLKAAEYLRASTDHQKFSIENQKRAIAQYAAKHGITIVRSYSDPAKTGVTMRKRTGLKKLITDVHEPDRNFNVILVFDVSRWGRFRDIDESAHYEFLCKARGVSIRYCAEPFLQPTFAFTEANIGRFAIYKLGSLGDFYPVFRQKVQSLTFLLSRPST